MIVEDRQVVIKEVTTRQVVFGGEAGPAGPQGLPGAAGGATLEFPFSYGDATPATVTTATGGKLVYGVALHIDTAFDGTGAALKVGDAGQLDRLMATTENDPTTAASYTSTPSHEYAADTVILLSITPGSGASQGSGVLVLYIQQ